MRTNILLKGAIGALALSLALPAGAGLRRRLDLRAAVHLPHRPLRRLGHADRRRHARLSDHAQRARRRHRRRQARRRRMRDRLRHQEGPRVLRRGQAEEPGDRQSVVDRHHAVADPQGLGRQDPDPVDGLWPLGLRQGRRLPVDFQPAGHLLGRPLGNPQICRRRLDRRAEGQDDRLSLFRRRASAGSRCRSSSRSPRRSASTSSSIRWRRPTCRTSRRNGSTSAATIRISSSCTAGAR